MSIPDNGYSRNAACAPYYVSTFLFMTSVDTDNNKRQKTGLPIIAEWLIRLIQIKVTNTSPWRSND